MMSSIPKEIQQVFDDAVMQKSLSLEVFGAITKLKESYDATVRDLDKERTAHLVTRDLLAKKSNELADCSKLLAAMQGREAEILAAEKVADRLKYIAETETDRRKEMLALVGLVFRSPVYKSSMIGTVPGGVPQKDQYGTIQYPTIAGVSEQRTVSEE